MKTCEICGWENPNGLDHCEHCNAPLAHDVFISYSRKDYVDDKGDVLPNNVLSKVKDLFKAHGVSYWFDEEGIYSGDEFASVLTRAIRNCKIFLFVSSKNSNQSKWTSNEISTALEFKKIIIPFRLDESPYNDSVMMKIVSYDYIECKDEKKALDKLLRAVKHHLPSSKHQRKSMIDVPDGAKGATVIFDIGGKRTERVFSYDNGEVKIADEKILGKEQHSDAKSSQSGASCESFSRMLKSKRFQRLFICAILLIAVAGGIIAFYSINGKSDNSRIEIVPKESEPNACRPTDLGLTSGTMWADRNIGAAAPHDFGDLYAWGEITKKKDYSQGMYNLTDKPHSKITTAKNDVAKSVLGEDWAIPTEKQFKELLSECQWEWIQIEGHYGFKIIGKNGNHIFFPAAGWICSTKADYQNKYGYYWTSERTTSNPQFARSLQFPRDGKGIIGNGYLYYGRSIRAVYVIAAAAE